MNIWPYTYCKNRNNITFFSSYFSGYALDTFNVISRVNGSKDNPIPLNYSKGVDANGSDAKIYLNFQQF